MENLSCYLIVLAWKIMTYINKVLHFLRLIRQNPHRIRFFEIYYFKWVWYFLTGINKGFFCVYVYGLYTIKLVTLSIDNKHLTHISVLAVNFNKDSFLWGRLEIKKKREVASTGGFWKRYLLLFGKKKSSLRIFIDIETSFNFLVCAFWLRKGINWNKEMLPVSHQQMKGENIRQTIASHLGKRQTLERI